LFVNPEEKTIMLPNYQVRKLIKPKRKKQNDIYLTH
jgi:hypothetical protein